MGDPYLIYGRVEFPKNELAAWREAEITDHLDVAGNEFEPTTVGSVLDEAASFGFAYGQLIEVEESATALSIRAYLIDSEYWQAVKPIITAFHAAAAFGGGGDLRWAEAPGHPHVLTIKKGKATLEKSSRKPPAGDDEAQQAILDRVVALSAKKKKPTKKR